MGKEREGTDYLLCGTAGIILAEYQYTINLFLGFKQQNVKV